MLLRCMQHNLPGLKSIRCVDYDDGESAQAMEARIPARLAGVQELVLATLLPLQLVFDNARGAGEALETFHAIGREVRVGAAAVKEINAALLERGLTLGVARAGEQHEVAPSQCVYIRAVLAPELSYHDAFCIVNECLKEWRGCDSCGQCGASLSCVKAAGALDGIL